MVAQHFISLLNSTRSTKQLPRYLETEKNLEVAHQRIDLVQKGMVKFSSSPWVYYIVCSYNLLSNNHARLFRSASLARMPWPSSSYVTSSLNRSRPSTPNRNIQRATAEMFCKITMNDCTYFDVRIDQCRFIGNQYVHKTTGKRGKKANPWMCMHSSLWNANRFATLSKSKRQEIHL